MVLVVKNPPATMKDLRDKGSIPGSEDTLEKGMATHSGILAWRIRGQRSLVGCSSWGGESDIMSDSYFISDSQFEK